MDGRLKELDSLRGLASLTVLFGHFLNIFPIIFNSTYGNTNNWLVKTIKYTPLHIFWSGHEAVIFFFALSGFVLALPFLKSTVGIPYTSFLVKRVCRIYLPYFIAVTFAILMNIFLYKGGISGLSNWFNNVWQSPVDIKLVLSHFSLVSSFSNDKFDPVLWSLVYEMRISLIFPVLMLLVIKFNWKFNMLIGVSSTIFAIAGNKAALHFFGLNSDYFDTFAYIGMFIAGALLAKHRGLIIKGFTCLGGKYKILCMAGAVAFYSHHWWIESTGLLKIGLIKRIYGFNFITDWFTLIGVTAFIIIGLSSKKVSSLLLNRYILFLGNISYSLYLYHAICLISSIYIFYNVLPIWSILMIAFASSLAFSALGYYLIEVPSIRLGKYLTQRKPKSVLLTSYSSIQTNE